MPKLQTTFQSLFHAPGIWTLSLAAVASLCSLVGTAWLARYRFRLNFYKAETERQLMPREQARLDLVTQHEQSRLDHAFEAELEFLGQITRRMKAEFDGQVSAVPAPQPKREPARVVKRAA